jgi:murein DD-endopeptidase MepM/ murein hydrolase activator NlpD
MKLKRLGLEISKKSIVLTLLLLLVNYPAFSYGSDLNSKLDQTRTQKDELIKKENRAQEEAQSLAARIASMDEQIKQVAKEIKRTKKEIKENKEQIELTQIEIEKQVIELEKQEETLDEALLYLYEEQDQPLLYRLFSFDTFSRILDRQEYLGAAQEKVSDTIVEVSNLKTSLEGKRESLITDKQDLKELRVQLKAAKKSIKEEQKEKEKLLKETKGREDKYEMLVAAKKAEEANILKKIQDLSRTGEGRHYDGSRNKKEEESGKQDKEKISRGYIWPIKIVGDYRHQVGQYYGMTDYAKSGAYNGAPHNGIDLSSIPNKNGFLDLRVRAAKEGKVIMVTHESVSGGWGNAVVVEHPDGMFTLYGHLSRVVVKEGQKVKQGQMLGIEGNTGASTGRHLHFSIYMKITIYKTPWYYGPGYDYQWTLNPLEFLKN